MQQISCTSVADLKKIEKLSTLKSLALSNFNKVTDYEPYLAKCINLERLEIHWDTVISNQVFKLPKLQQLLIKNSGYFYEIPNEIVQLEQLRSLEINGESLDQISENISYLNNLETLNLNYNKLTELPETLEELTELKHLGLLRNKLSKFPEAVLKLPKLTELFLDKKWYNTLTEKYPTVLKRIAYVFTHSPLEKRYARPLANICNKNQYNWHFRAVLFNLLANNSQKIDQLASFDDLLAATDVLQIEVIRLKALEYLSKKAKSSFPKTLKQGACIAIVGKIGIKKPELKAKLKVHGIGYSSKVNDKSTHLLIGQMPKEGYKLAQEKDIPIVTEKNILDYLEQVNNPYLLTGSQEEQVENQESIGNLLVSGLDDNIRLALTLFQEGGFPKGLITELLVAKGLNSNKKILSDIDRLYLQYASSELIELSKKRMSIFNKGAAESYIKSNINKLAKHTEINGVQLAKYIYAINGTAKNYLLYNLPAHEKIIFLKENFLAGKKLNLSALELTSIPAEIYKLVDLEELSIRYNKFKSLPKKLSSLSNLKTLDIRNNYHLINELPNIRTLLPNCKILH